VLHQYFPKKYPLVPVSTSLEPRSDNTLGLAIEEQLELQNL
jgi:hypothetical protein